MKRKFTESEYEFMAREQLIEKIKLLPFVSEIESEMTECQYYDVVLRVSYNDGTFTKIIAEVKSRGEKRFAKDFVNRIEYYKNKEYCNTEFYVFIAPYITEETGRFLFENGISYMDLSGNCYIITDRILIHSTGNKNKYIEKREQKNHFTKSAVTTSIILRTMLDDYTKIWQVKMLSELTQKSLGAVSNVKKFLLDKDYITIFDNGFRLNNISELLKSWSKDYSKTNYIEKRCYSFDRIPDFETKITAWNIKHSGSVTLGGFSAAVRYSPTVRYNKITLYIEEQDVREFITDMNLKEVDSGENISIIIPSDKTPFLFSQKINNFLVTSPVQTVLDLLNNAGRGEEAANAIIEKEFKKYDL